MPVRSAQTMRRSAVRSSDGVAELQEHLRSPQVGVDRVLGGIDLRFGEDPDELVTPAPHRPDEVLRLPVVAQCAPDCLDPTGQGCFAYEASAPHRVEQLVLRHDPVTVLHEVREHVEHLRLDSHRNPVAPQLITGKVENELTEVPNCGLERGWVR